MRKYSFNNNKLYGGPIGEIFGSDDGFALFLNGMGFNSIVISTTVGEIADTTSLKVFTVRVHFKLSTLCFI